MGKSASHITVLKHSGHTVGTQQVTVTKKFPNLFKNHKAVFLQVKIQSPNHLGFSKTTLKLAIQPQDMPLSSYDSTWSTMPSHHSYTKQSLEGDFTEAAQGGHFKEQQVIIDYRLGEEKLKKTC